MQKWWIIYRKVSVFEKLKLPIWILWFGLDELAISDHYELTRAANQFLSKHLECENFLIVITILTKG